jgi:hypothetical protein
MREVAMADNVQRRPSPQGAPREPATAKASSPAPIISQISVDEAQRLTERIMIQAQSAWRQMSKHTDMLDEAKAALVHKAVGYTSWAAYLKDILGDQHWHLDRDYRRDLVMATAKINIAKLVEHVDHFQRRVMEDAINEASAIYWSKRAETFEAARPRPGDFTGRASHVDLAARDRELSEVATACRNRAQLAPISGAAA